MDLCVNDVNDGYLATGEGATEEIFRVPGRNRIRDLRNAGYGGRGSFIFHVALKSHEGA